MHGSSGVNSEVEPKLAHAGEVAIWYLDSALATTARPVEHLNW